MHTLLRTACLALGLSAFLAACGDSGPAPSADAPVQKASKAASGGACSLLTREQVDTVIPGNDGGTEDTSLASLYDDVQTGQCRWLHVEGMDLQFLVLTVYRAASQAGFDKVDISGRLSMGSPRKLDIGDVSFLDDIDDSTIEIQVSKGRNVFEMNLNAKSAAEKSEPLIELARAVAAKL